MVGDDLGDGESCFDSKTDVAKEIDIVINLTERSQVNDSKDSNEVGEEHPVSMQLWLALGRTA